MLYKKPSEYIQSSNCLGPSYYFPLGQLLHYDRNPHILYCLPDNRLFPFVTTFVYYFTRKTPKNSEHSKSTHVVPMAVIPYPSLYILWNACQILNCFFLIRILFSPHASISGTSKSLQVHHCLILKLFLGSKMRNIFEFTIPVSSLSRLNAIGIVA